MELKGITREWDSLKKDAAARAASAAPYVKEGKIVDAKDAVALLEAVIKPGDKVNIEGNNQKQADFLAKTLCQVDPGKVHDLHMVQSVLTLPEHLDVFEKGIAKKLDMSFSGLKTAALNLIHNAEQKGEQLDIPSLCASFSLAVCKTLVPRTMLALKQCGYQKLAIAGGVAANSRIRAEFQRETQTLGASLFTPPLSLCGDNGAMIGAQGYYEYLAGNVASQNLNAFATMSISQLTY